MSCQADDLFHDISRRFSAIQWHDSKLISFQLLPKDNGQRHDLKIGLRLLTNAEPGNYDWQDGSVEIEQCRTIRLSLDMLGIQLCGGDIAAAVCENASDMKDSPEYAQIRTFDLPQGDNPFAHLVHFRIIMIPPGGEINILAKNFKLITKETPS